MIELPNTGRYIESIILRCFTFLPLNVPMLDARDPSARAPLQKCTDLSLTHHRHCPNLRTARIVQVTASDACISRQACFQKSGLCAFPQHKAALFSPVVNHIRNNTKS